MVGLGDLAGGAFDSEALAASGDGSIVVGQATSAAGTEAFIWDATNGMRNLKTVLTGLGLDLTGWTLTHARGISDDGLIICGEGTNPLGDTEAWVADLTPFVPASSNWYLILTGIVLAVCSIFAIGWVRKISAT